jgi:hypothetical protein
LSRPETNLEPLEHFVRRRLVRGGVRLTEPAPELLRAERWPRAQAVRRIRAAIRRGRLVIVHYPRWSDVTGMLDDLAVDLAVADTPLQSARIDLSDPRLRETPGAWGRLLAIVSQHADVPLPSAAAWPMAREGFRFGLRAIFEAARENPPRVLLAERGHNLPWEILADMATAWSQWAAGQSGPAAIRMLVTTRADVPPMVPDDCELIDLPDFGEEEAASWLTGWLGVDRVPEIRRMIRQMGGVPDLLRQVVTAGKVPDTSTPEGALRAWGGQLGRLESAVQLARTEENVAERLDALFAGPLPTRPAVDQALVRAGLVRVRQGPYRRDTALRSPSIVFTAGGHDPHDDRTLEDDEPSVSLGPG